MGVSLLHYQLGEVSYLFRGEYELGEVSYLFRGGHELGEVSYLFRGGFRCHISIKDVRSFLDWLPSHRNMINLTMNFEFQCCRDVCLRESLRCRVNSLLWQCWQC